MKKTLLLVAIIAITNWAKSQQINLIDSQKSAESTIEILSENTKEITLKLNLNAYSLQEVQTPNGTEVVVTSPNGINYMDKGLPDVPYFATSVRIPAKGKAVSEIIEANYITVENINIAPSKGSVKRNIDPATVPYEYGKCYKTDAYIPATEALNSEAFCIRDVRGTSVRFFPFLYNPVQKQLKIYTDITVKIKFTAEKSTNEISKSYEKIDEFEAIYNRLFINYAKNQRYTQVQDGHPGRMLIICKDTYASAMNDFVNWKREKGIETEMVMISTIGNSATNIQSYISNYFDTHSDLAYILLVGDGADIASNVYTSGSGYYAETHTSDNQYAYLVGNDNYADVFIGRFSGESTTHIQNQVRKVVLYEKELSTDATWLTNGYGSASNEGGGNSGGHNQGQGVESDMTHMGYIQTDLENYGYTVTRVNQVSGSYNYTSDVAATSAAFNQGLGLACYIGHGDTQEWASTGYTSSHVSALTNENKNGFIISVACVNGDFNGNTCFAETWLRASKNGNPTGALAFLGSTINQDWNPPMTAQDEMIDIITESLNGNIKRTIGGISFNGYFRMIQDYPANSSDGDGVATANTWTIFGDPSTMFRSKTPQEMTVTHPNVQTIGQTTFVVNCDTDEALISLTKVVDNEVIILGIGYVENGTATITHTALTEPCTIKLTATAYNKVTYQSEINVIAPEGAYIVNSGYTLNDNAGNDNGLADYNETITINQSVENVGNETAIDVNMTISSSNTYVTIDDANEYFGDIAATNELTQNDAFSINIRDGIADQTSIQINYTITAANCDDYSGSFSIVANAPKPVITFSHIDDSESGNNNGLLDAGETVKLIFNLTNEGHAQIQAGRATMTNNSEIINLNISEVTTNTNDSQTLEFECSLDEDIPTGTITNFVVDFVGGMYNANLSVGMPIGLQIEDWENNDFNSYEWENNGNYPWTIVSTGAYEGTYCAKSGTIGNNASSELSITINVLSNDNVEFYKKVSCEAAGTSWWGTGENFYDYLAFYIDDEMKGQWAGEVSWSLETYSVTAGTHTLKWLYKKDVSDTGGSDCAWIDNIKLPAFANSITNIHTNIAVDENSMSIYPNPTNENAYINLELTNDSETEIIIYNSLGQIVKTIDSQKLNSGSNIIPIETSSLNNGMYLVKTSIEGKTITKNLSIIR